MVTLDVTQAEADAVLDARYLARWSRHINFNKQAGIGVVLEHPQRSLRALQQFRAAQRRGEVPVR